MNIPKNKIIGTHNSMSYLTPSNFLGKLLRWTSQCQTLTLDEQLERGVRFFDLRVSFNDKEYPYLCHGLVKYEGHGALSDIYGLIWILDSYRHTHKTDIYVRLVLESFLIEPTDGEIALFQHLCNYFLDHYKNIHFQMITKYNWEQINCQLVSAKEVFHSPSNLIEVLKGPKRLLHYQEENLNKDIQEDIVVIDFLE